MAAMEKAATGCKINQNRHGGANKIADINKALDHGNQHKITKSP